MTDTTFSRAVVIDTDTHDTEIEILRDGDCVGCIRRGSDRRYFPTTSPPRWIACSYEVIISNNETKDRCFHVDDYGHPRTALAAAKRYARETLNREGA